MAQSLHHDPRPLTYNQLKVALPATRKLKSLEVCRWHPWHDSADIKPPPSSPGGPSPPPPPEPPLIVLVPSQIEARCDGEAPCLRLFEEGGVAREAPLALRMGGRPTRPVRGDEAQLDAGRDDAATSRAANNSASCLGAGGAAMAAGDPAARHDIGEQLCMNGSGTRPRRCQAHWRTPRH